MADNLEEINCPACGAKMVKVYMPSQGVNLDVCVNGCGGIYFDNREFSKFNQPHEDITPIIEILKNREFKSVDESTTRRCPVCRSDMVKNHSSANQEIQVDECYACGGMFLDYQELEKIRAEYNSNNLKAEDIMKKLYNDVGRENIMPINLPSNNENWKKGALIGALLGLIPSVVFMYINQTMIDTSDNDMAAISAAVMAVGICLICAGIGALAAKLNSNKT